MIRGLPLGLHSATVQVSAAAEDESAQNLTLLGVEVRDYYA